MIPQREYVEILEKTNQQLSNLSGAYGTIVGSLSVLFTALTIAAAIILFFQSSDFKRTVRLQKNFLSSLAKRSLAAQEEHESNSRKILEAYKKLEQKHPSSEVGEKIKIMEKELESLRKNIAVSQKIVTISTNPSRGNWPATEVCEKCGREHDPCVWYTCPHNPKCEKCNMCYEGSCGIEIL